MRPTQIEDPLRQLVDSLSSTLHSTNSIAFRAQLLLFFIDRHWSLLHLDLCQTILQAATALGSHADLQVQCWAFLLAATAASKDLPTDPASPGPSSHTRQLSSSTADWDSVWSWAIRKLNQVEVCRTAAHTANILLALDRVSPATVSSSLETLAHELEVQSPHFPSDAVCEFFEWVVGLAGQDVRLFRLGLVDKVQGWLVQAWRPLHGTVRTFSIGQTRPRADPLNLSALASMIARICELGRAPTLPYDCVVPDGAVAEQAVALSETAAVRDFVEGRMPAHARSTSEAASRFRSPRSCTSHRAGQEDSLRKTRGRVSAWLAKTLESLASEADAAGPTHWTGLSPDSVRRHLELACLGLVVEGMMQLNELRSNSVTVKAGAELVQQLAGVVAGRRWGVGDRVTILQGELSGSLDLHWVSLR